MTGNRSSIADREVRTASDRVLYQNYIAVNKAKLVDVFGKWDENTVCQMGKAMEIYGPLFNKWDALKKQKEEDLKEKKKVREL